MFQAKYRKYDFNREATSSEPQKAVGATNQNSNLHYLICCQSIYTLCTSIHSIRTVNLKETLFSWRDTSLRIGMVYSIRVSIQSESRTTIKSNSLPRATTLIRRKPKPSSLVLFLSSGEFLRTPTRQTSNPNNNIQ